MDDIIDDSNEILFTVKFLGRVEVVRPSGVQILEEAAQNLKTPDKYSSEKASKKSKVHLYLSSNTLDILEHKTKFLLYSCPLTTVSFCAVLSSSPKVFGFVAQHLATDTFHCYLFQSRKFVSFPTAALRVCEMEQETTCSAVFFFTHIFRLTCWFLSLVDPSKLHQKRKVAEEVEI
ncbi:PTB domain-containing engulfment adapter protein 1 isoform X1 [Nothobranchius furzeri]|uniref:PTB domain-containing engulfment adapter protein 1 isoform X1 n=1 Tax=Nothobranchius furzeri TaxID=105023 RepID=UPI003904A93A